MNVPGGGKNDIPNRLKRQFAIFYVPPPSAVAVHSIFGALIQASHRALVINIKQALSLLKGHICMLFSERLAILPARVKMPILAYACSMLVFFAVLIVAR